MNQEKQMDLTTFLQTLNQVEREVWTAWFDHYYYQKGEPDFSKILNYETISQDRLNEIHKRVDQRASELLKNSERFPPVGIAR